MLRRFLQKLRRRRSLEREIADELAFHREMAQAAGDSIPLGNELLIRETAADPWRFVFWESLWQDLKYAARDLRRNPLLVLIAVIAVAVGIGSVTAVFSLVDAVLLKPVPVTDPDSFVILMTTTLAKTGKTDSVPGANAPRFALWRQHTVLRDVSAYARRAMNYSTSDVAEQVESMQVSADALRCWGTPLLLGRDFTPQDDVPGGPKVVLLGRQFWERRFASDPQIPGKTISLDGERYTVIGVAADSPFLLEQGPLPDVYVTLQLHPNSTDPTRRFQVTARLRPGVSLAQADAQLRIAAAGYRSRFPNDLGANDGFAAVPYGEFLTGEWSASGNRNLLMVLLGAVGLVLLIACANVANLLLLRAETRRREIAVRAAIGAGRARIIRQLLIESLLLSAAGGGLGLLLGFAGIRALLAINTAGLPRLGEHGIAVGLDWRVMAFAAAATVLSAAFFGILPALEGSRADLNAILQGGGRSGSGLRQSRARAVLVVSEVALAVVLLVGSALLIRTFVALYAVPQGFDATNVVTMQMKLMGAQYEKSAGVAGVMNSGLERIRETPGVSAAASTYFIPLQTAVRFPFRIAGAPAMPSAAGWVPVSSGYFEVLRIPLKSGRTFTDRDDEKSPPVAIVNEAMARQYWAGADPLKDRIAIGGNGRQFRGEPERQIVGVVGNAVDTELYNGARPTMYVPQAQITDAMNDLLVQIQPIAWLVRTQGKPQALIPAIREQLREATGLPTAEVRSMNQVESLSTARQRFNMLLMSVFAGTALLLAAIGIYGLMSYSVEQRRREIGIRLALGAEANRVRKRVVFEGMRLALAGATLGIALAYDLTHFLASFLFGVQPRDPAVFVGVPLVLSAVALLAVSIPAARASRVDPIQALRD